MYFIGEILIMVGSVNKVILIGNLGQSPDVRYGQSGLKIISFSLATSERWKDKTTGEYKEKVEWHKIVVFNEYLLEICERYLNKGSKVYLEGSLQTRKWIDKTGIEKYTTEIILQRFRGELIILDDKKSNVSDSFKSSDKNVMDKSNQENVTNDFDDEIPF